MKTSSGPGLGRPSVILGGCPARRRWRGSHPPEPRRRPGSWSAAKAAS